MAFPAQANILELMVLAIWKILCETRFNQKNPLFARFLTTEMVTKQLLSAASIVFAPGLFEVLQSTTPPSLQFFKNLPDNTWWGSHWAVYAIVLEKLGFRPKRYAGSGTSAHQGVHHRFWQYDNGEVLPFHVEKALDDGWVITHKGMLCWIPIPAASFVPVRRILFVALESTLAYLLSAMMDDTRNHVLKNIGLWDRDSLEYDGLCSHCSLNEAILGEFDLDDEQLEELAREKEQKRVELKSENNSSWHYKQMAENYDDYIVKSTERVSRSRANNPGRDAKRQAERQEKNRQNKTYHCTPCNITLGSKQVFAMHEKSPKHLRQVTGAQSTFRCSPCNLGFHNPGNLRRHNQSLMHKRRVEQAQSNILTDSLSRELPEAAESNPITAAFDSDLPEASFTKASDLGLPKTTSPSQASSDHALPETSQSYPVTDALLRVLPKAVGSSSITTASDWDLPKTTFPFPSQASSDHALPEASAFDVLNKAVSHRLPKATMSRARKSTFRRNVSKAAGSRSLMEYFQQDLPKAKASNPLAMAFPRDLPEGAGSLTH
ncbi:MAG: hypothetical protein Q9198_008859 [Flavoplaca austrocitrina]